MDRRKSLKLIVTGAVATPVAIAGCTNDNNDKAAVKNPEATFNLDRNPDELKYEKSLLAQERFFTEHEMRTITVLADIIIPKDDVSGSASEAKVPEFIEGGADTARRRHLVVVHRIGLDRSRQDAEVILHRGHLGAGLGFEKVGDSDARQDGDDRDDDQKLDQRESATASDSH